MDLVAEVQLELRNVHRVGDKQPTELLAAYEPLGVAPGREYDPANVAQIDGKRFRAIAEQVAAEAMAMSQDPEMVAKFGTQLFHPKEDMTLELLVLQSILGPIGLPVEEALAAVNLLTLQRRPIYALSGGQKQRIAIAGALARHCEVLLLDEPTALLDLQSQRDLVSQVRRLVTEKGLTALWVTHRLDELDYCDGAFLLEAGKVVDRGNPQRLRQQLMQSGRGDG